MYAKVKCEISAKTYNYLEEINLLESKISPFFFHYYKGMYFFMNSEYGDSQESINQAHDILIQNFSDSLFIQEVTKIPPSFVPLNKINIYVFVDIRHWLHEVNLFRALLLLEQDEFQQSIEVILESIEEKPTYSHELFLLYYLNKQVKNIPQSNLYYNKLIENNPEYINSDLHDNSKDVNELFNRIKVLRDVISKYKTIKYY